MTAEEYIERYGANLTESEKRYILAFGPPDVPDIGGGRSQYTPGLRIADAPTQSEAERMQRGGNYIEE